MNFSSVVKQLKKIAGRDAVLDQVEDLMLYEYDAGILTGSPRAVVFPETTEQVSRIMRLLSESGFPVVPRGAGTGLSGGAIARQGENAGPLAGNGAATQSGAGAAGGPSFSPSRA